jgi:NADH-quinone oxidoreductase subunit L
METYIKLIVLLPILAAIIVGLNTKKISVPFAQIITTGATLTAAVLAWIVFFDVLDGNKYKVVLFNWVSSGDFVANWALRVDMLTALMLTLVTTVSSLVHLYSVGYMGYDEHPQRFMAYLSLFTFFMLMLVTADNLLQVFLGWEGVGLASYLLIGFWYKKPSANAAAIKAFLVNRVGDFGLALGLFAAFVVFGTISFDEIFLAAPSKANEVITILGCQFDAITLICILLFIGCMGKSAQLGLHTWLPDAMEGPTPVSALIHAATMVTAGIFLVARFSPVFEMSEAALAMVAIVGATTAIFAATIALTQNDIKKIIAYSTCSQLGFMFFACGVSAYAAGMFHLYTHGFFKALLFLGAGSVIHAMHHEQDIRNMGGIWKKIPFTYAMMLIGTLAITGFPYLSGYFSKDMVLETAYAAGSHGNVFGAYAYWVGITTALLTAFYSWRLIFLTFHGKTRADHETFDHAHESPKVMLLPLLVLSIGAVFVGYIFYKNLGITHHELEFWNGSIASANPEFNVYEAAHHVPQWVILSPMIVGAVGFILALIFYIFVPSLPAKFSSALKPLYKLSYNKWYFDEIYDFLFVRPIKKLGLFFWKFCDVKIVDGMPNGSAKLSVFVGSIFKKFQTGYVYNYSFIMLLGLIAMLTYVIYR